jgi:GTP-binding protein
VEEALDAKQPPLRQNRRAKVYYSSQVDTHPPTIVLFTNGPELFDPPYRKYLLNFLRDRLPFTDIPIRLVFRNRTRTEGGAANEADDMEQGTDRQQPANTAKPRQARTKLPFRTRLEDGESQKMNPDLWRDL